MFSPVVRKPGKSPRKTPPPTATTVQLGAKVGIDRITQQWTVVVHARVNDHDFNSLFSALNQAVDILYRNRTPEPGFIAAYDTLKQSRAMLESTVKKSGSTEMTDPIDLAA